MCFELLSTVVLVSTEPTLWWNLSAQGDKMTLKALVLYCSWEAMMLWKASLLFLRVVSQGLRMTFSK